MDHHGTCKSDSGNPCIQGDIYRDKDTSFEKINQFEESWYEKKYSQRLNTRFKPFKVNLLEWS